MSSRTPETINITEAPDKDSELTPDDIEMFYHTMNMLELSIEAMSKVACPDHDSGILLARAAAGMMLGVVCAHTTEAEFDAMQAKYLGDDDAPHENHAGTETVQ